MKSVKSKFITGCMLMVAFLFLMVNGYGQDLKTALKLSTSERYEDANDVFKQLIKTQPNNADLYFYYSENLLKSYKADPYSSTLKEACADADKILEEGYKADSTNSLIAIGMGEVTLLKTGDTIAADNYFKKAEVFPRKLKRYTDRNVLVLIKLGTAQLFAANPRFDKAIAFLDKAKEARPSDPDVNNALGDIYMAESDASNAIANYNRALYLDPSNPIYQVKIGNIYMGARNLNLARSFFEDAEKVDSTYAPVYKGLGTLYNMSGYYKAAEDNFKKFLDLCGDNTPALISYANALYQAHNFDKTLSVVESILKVDSSRNYLNRLAAYSAYDKHPADYPLALKYIKTFFRRAAPDRIIVKDYLYYGNILLKLRRDTNDIDNGLRMLIKAYEMDTTNEQLYSNIANTAYALRRFNIAAQVLNDKVNTHKATPYDYFTLGKVYYQMKQFGKSDTVFEELTKIQPDNIDAYLWIANANASMDPSNNLGLAKPKYEQVIEKASVDTVKYASELFDSYYYLSSYYLTHKPVNYTLAAKYYGKMLTLNPENKNWVIKGYIGLAVIAGKKKEYVRARDIYRILVKLDPENPDFKHAVNIYDKQIKAVEAANQ